MFRYRVAVFVLFNSDSNICQNVPAEEEIPDKGGLL